MTDDRLVEIESRLAHQERLLEELNDAVAAQQASVLRLEETCRALTDRVRAMHDTLAGPGPADERPPHY